MISHTEKVLIDCSNNNQVITLLNHINLRIRNHGVKQLRVFKQAISMMKSQSNLKYDQICQQIAFKLRSNSNSMNIFHKNCRSDVDKILSNLTKNGINNILNKLRNWKTKIIVKPQSDSGSGQQIIMKQATNKEQKQKFTIQADKKVEKMEIEDQFVSEEYKQIANDFMFNLLNNIEVFELMQLIFDSQPARIQKIQTANLQILKEILNSKDDLI